MAGRWNVNSMQSILKRFPAIKTYRSIAFRYNVAGVSERIASAGGTRNQSRGCLSRCAGFGSLNDCQRLRIMGIQIGYYSGLASSLVAITRIIISTVVLESRLQAEFR